MSVPVILKNSDVGAPQLTGENGSLYTVLKWAVPQLGWTIEFDNGVDKIVFRNDSVFGSGYYLRVDDNSANLTNPFTPNDPRFAKISGFETMSDIDTGTGEFPTAAERVWTKSYLADDTPQDYIFIGTEKIFYFGTWNERFQRSTGYRLYWAGDFIPFNQNDPSAFFIGHRDIASSLGDADPVTPIGTVIYGAGTVGISGVNAGNTLEEGLAKSFDTTLLGDRAIFLIHQQGAGGSQLSFSHEPGTANGPDTLNNSLNTSRLYILARPTPASSDCLMRGFFPGLLVPLQAVSYNEYWQANSPYDNLDILPGMYNGKQYADLMMFWGNIFFGTSNSAGGNQAFLFDVTSDWDNW